MIKKRDNKEVSLNITRLVIVAGKPRRPYTQITIPQSKAAELIKTGAATEIKK